MSPDRPPVLERVNHAQDERWTITQRILASQHFAKSPQLSKLLLYLYEQTLLERQDLLTEQMIATRVFERLSGFDPSVDTIVRSHMVRLRQKLERYAREGGAEVRIRVTVPKGEYLIRFEPVASLGAENSPQDSIHPAHTKQSPAAPHGAPVNPYAVIAWGLGAAVLALLAALTTVLLHSTGKAAPAEPPPHPLWSHLFQPREATTFVAADSGLVLLHVLTAKYNTLAEYLSRDFSRQTRGLSPARVNDIMGVVNRRYTSFVDLNLYRRVASLPSARSARLEVKYARDLNINDLKQGNVILSGSCDANPWLELYEPQMNFIGDNDETDHIFRFINRRPQRNEPKEFSLRSTDPKQPVLGVLAYLPNLDGDGNALIVEGSSMAGTEAIGDFLFDDHALLPFLAELHRPGQRLPHFEVLIQSTSVNGSASAFHILAYRTYP